METTSSYQVIQDKPLFFLQWVSGGSSKFINHVVKPDAVRARNQMRTGKMEVPSSQVHHYTIALYLITIFHHQLSQRNCCLGQSTASGQISNFSFICHHLYLRFYLDWTPDLNYFCSPPDPYCSNLFYRKQFSLLWAGGLINYHGG